MIRISKIDKSSKVPLHSQVYESIKSKIENKEYKPGDMLPPEPELQKTYSVSRITIRRAISDLENEGYVEKQPGKGTFVRVPKHKYDLRQLTSFSEDAKLHGEISRSVIRDFKVVEADAKVADSLSIPVGEEVYYLERTRLSGDLVVGLHQAYLKKSEGLQLSLSEFTETSSLYEILREKGVSLEYANEILEARNPAAEIKEILNIQNDLPIFYKERLTFDSGDRPVEFVKMYYRSDAYQYKVRLNVLNTN